MYYGDSLQWCIIPFVTYICTCYTYMYEYTHVTSQVITEAKW